MPPPEPTLSEKLVAILSRLNLSSPLSVAGNHFNEIVALSCLIAGGFLLLYGWQHNRYVLGVMGGLVGGWTGLVLKGLVAPMGAVPALPYVALCGAIGALLVVTLRRFTGILLGGFTTACVAIVFFPTFFSAGFSTYVALSVSFLLGGGLGALFPRFFFIVNASLIGASFCTYGLSVFLTKARATPQAKPEWVLLHLGVFLPLIVLGLVYQYWTAPDDDGSDLGPIRKSKPKAKAASPAKKKEEPEPAGARN